MIPFLVKAKLAEKYGESFDLPSNINLLRPYDEAYKGDEHDLQKNFFKYLSTYYLQNPYLYLFHAIPNGGTRNKIEAGRLKAEGVTSGIPDTFLPIPKKGYNGLYIEFKTKRNKPSDDQRIMMLMLDSQGYKVVCVNTLEDSLNVFDNYING
jgi:hypothetical protein